MLRIIGTGKGQFELTGRLVDGWVDELAGIVDGLDGRAIQIDLRHVTFVDQNGIRFLRELSTRGAVMVGGSAFVNTLVWGGSDDVVR